MKFSSSLVLNCCCVGFWATIADGKSKIKLPWCWSCLRSLEWGIFPIPGDTSWIFCVFGNKKLCPQLLWNSLQIISTAIASASLLLAFPNSNDLSELLFNMEFGTVGCPRMGSQERRRLDGFCLLQWCSWLRVLSSPKTPGAQTDRAWLVLCSAPLHSCVPPLVIFSERGEY